MIAAYGGFSLEVDNLSNAHDTVLLEALLDKVNGTASNEPVTVDCEDAGTVSRFMMTYLACKLGTWLLTGTERLKQRPMVPLINALRQLGADITCLDDEGYLPLRICGKTIQGGFVEMDVSQSSQFVTSLLLAAPTWENGLRLRLETKPVSEPYIQMTVSMMRHFGIDVEWEGSEIIVRHQSYQPRRFVVSADWSSASYWYEMMALSEGGNLFLKGLREDPAQGDSKVAEIYKVFGVQTVFEKQGTRITKNETMPDFGDNPLVFNFNDAPDLFPAVFVTCVALHCDAVFKGITTLKLKESDRINCLITELSKYYTFINIFNNNEIVIRKSSLSDININKEKVIFNTYNDHRIAMALAGLLMRFEQSVFDYPDAVSKSYPDFWKNLEALI
jgi:3-phosphoshikimate 1-carboxyvinyltransferase